MIGGAGGKRATEARPHKREQDRGPQKIVAYFWRFGLSMRWRGPGAKSAGRPRSSSKATSIRVGLLLPIALTFRDYLDTNLVTVSADDRATISHQAYLTKLNHPLEKRWRRSLLTDEPLRHVDDLPKGGGHGEYLSHARTQRPFAPVNVSLKGDRQHRNVGMSHAQFLD